MASALYEYGIRVANRYDFPDECGNEIDDPRDVLKAEEVEEVTVAAPEKSVSANLKKGQRNRRKRKESRPDEDDDKSVRKASAETSSSRPMRVQKPRGTSSGSKADEDGGGKWSHGHNHRKGRDKGRSKASGTHDGQPAQQPDDNFFGEDACQATDVSFGQQTLLRTDRKRHLREETGASGADKTAKSEGKSGPSSSRVRRLRQPQPGSEREPASDFGKDAHNDGRPRQIYEYINHHQDGSRGRGRGRGKSRAKGDSSVGTSFDFPAGFVSDDTSGFGHLTYIKSKDTRPLSSGGKAFDANDELNGKQNGRDRASFGSDGTNGFGRRGRGKGGFGHSSRGNSRANGESSPFDKSFEASGGFSDKQTARDRSAFAADGTNGFGRGGRGKSGFGNPRRGNSRSNGESSSISRSFEANDDFSSKQNARDRSSFAADGTNGFGRGGRGRSGFGNPKRGYSRSSGESSSFSRSFKANDDFGGKQNARGRSSFAADGTNGFGRRGRGKGGFGHSSRGNSRGSGESSFGKSFEAGGDFGEKQNARDRSSFAADGTNGFGRGGRGKSGFGHSSRGNSRGSGEPSFGKSFEAGGDFGEKQNARDRSSFAADGTNGFGRGSRGKSGFGNPRRGNSRSNGESPSFGNDFGSGKRHHSGRDQGRQCGPGQNGGDSNVRKMNPANQEHSPEFTMSWADQAEQADLENEQKMSLDEFKALSEKSRVHPSHNLRTVSETEDQNHWGDTQRLQQDDKTDEGTRKPRPARKRQDRSSRPQAAVDVNFRHANEHRRQPMDNRREHSDGGKASGSVGKTTPFAIDEDFPAL